MNDPFPGWFAALERRHLADLTFQEVRRSLQALSSLYVERRGRLGSGAALEAGRRPLVEAVDSSGWALQEARWTLGRLGLRGKTVRGDALSAALPTPPAGVIAAFTANELEDEARARLLARFLEAAAAGLRVLVVEPIARRSIPWWTEWSRAFTAAGGRDDEWRFPASLPERLRLLDKASGLDHRVLTGRSLWLNGSRRARTAGGAA